MNSEFSAWNAIASSVFGFAGGGLTILLRPWIEERALALFHPIRTEHDDLLFAAGCFNEGRLNFVKRANGPRYIPPTPGVDLELVDEGQVDRLVLRGFLTRESSLDFELTTCGWLRYDHLRPVYESEIGFADFKKRNSKK